LTLDELAGQYALLWLNGARYCQSCYWSTI